MTDSSPREVRKAEAPVRKGGGFRLRLFVLIVAPAVLLGFAATYLLSIARSANATVTSADFLLAFAGAFALVLVLAAGLAWLADLSLRRRLGDIERTLTQGSRGPVSLAAAGRQWQGLRALARAAHEAVSRTDDHAQDAEELKALQRAADDLQERIRSWAETEIAPSFEPAGPLGELTGALQTLSRHLEERFGEAREVTDLARQSLGDACESVERASRESGRSAREIAALLTAAGEVKRLGAQMTGRLRELSAAKPPAPVAAPSPLPERPVFPEPKPEAEVEAWRERVSSLGARLESLERLALRAALELAAEGIAERREAGPWLDRVETLRHVALGARALREESKAVAAELPALVSMTRAPRVVAPTPAPLPAPAPAIPVDVVAMAERVEQWGNDAYSRSERLSGLAQRLASEFASATSSTRMGADELAGLATRFESRAALGSPGEEAPVDPAWRAGARPLRLLTREDVVPEDDESPADRSAPRDG
jgi:hypothetical protein